MGHTYRMGGGDLYSEMQKIQNSKKGFKKGLKGRDSKKDLRAMLDSQLNMSCQCDAVSKIANEILGYMKGEY